jgi:hypothetical protein
MEWCSNSLKLGIYIGFIFLHVHVIFTYFPSWCSPLISCDVFFTLWWHRVWCSPRVWSISTYYIPLSGLMRHIATPKLWIFYPLIRPLLETLGTTSPKWKTLNELIRTTLNIYCIMLYDHHVQHNLHTFGVILFFHECWHMRLCLPHGSQTTFLWCLINIIMRYNFGMVEKEVEWGHEFPHSHLFCERIHIMCICVIGGSPSGQPRVPLALVKMHLECFMALEWAHVFILTP